MRLMNSLKDIDIIDVNYYSSYLSNENVSDSGMGLLNLMFSALLFTLKQIAKDLLCVFKNRSLRNRNVLFYNSVNQYNSLAPVYKDLDNAVFCTLTHNKDSRLPMAMGCFVAILLTPRFIRLLNRKSKKERDIILHDFVHYFFIEGMFIWWTVYLRITKPKRMFFSNDHLVWHRVLRMAAQFNNILTVYLQHASVTEKFPKLEFDLSLLEGKDALNKYRIKGVAGKVELIGMVKFDKYFSRINRNVRIQSIGICTNILDNESKIEELCYFIHSSLKGVDVFLRPHPRDLRWSFYKKMREKFHFQLSDSTKENSFEYLTKVDVNIAGETSIHLEAVLMNVYPVYFQLNRDVIDLYGYIRNRLVTDVFFNVDDLADFLSNIRNEKMGVRERAKYYVDTVNSEFDGASIELLKKYVF